jgi:hypothetical protein
MPVQEEWELTAVEDMVWQLLSLPSLLSPVMDSAGPAKSLSLSGFLRLKDIAA